MYDKDLKYNIIFFTNIPAFYKVNLYNRISLRKKILVIFIGYDRIPRDEDFLKGTRNFEYITLSDFFILRRLFKLIHILHICQYDKLIIGGWDSIWYWVSIFFSPKKYNAVVVESSHWESKTSGIMSWFKRLFLKRIATAYVSGSSQKKLVRDLKFKGNCIITQGVGLMNITQPPPFHQKKIIKNFIYVGRLSQEKNLFFLIEVFSRLPQFILNIVGAGPLEKDLKNRASKNIIFHGVVHNKNISEYYRTNDVFILPSLIEPWGMVVEEALNNGLPAIVSEHVGCAEQIIQNGYNGIIFPLSDPDALLKAILKTADINYYNYLRQNVLKMDFFQIAEEQVRSYLL